MTRDDLIAEVRDAFSGFARPAMFIRGTCTCDECLEHEQTMQSFTVDDLPIDELSVPGWDPICFASDEAFAYLMPGLAKLVLDHPDEYIQQFLFHLDNPDRMAAFAPRQAQALLHLLDFLLLEHAQSVSDNLAVEDLESAREKLAVRLHNP